MCLILFAKNSHPDFPLIIAANRDEFYERPTTPADFWPDQSDILAGRDLEAGGTWMGINKYGKLSMLTNFRDLTNIKPNAPSRGQLVSDFLLDSQSAKHYLKQIESKGSLYNGFNLIVGDRSNLFYYGNYQEGVHEIEDGVHGLSNALLDTNWPKVQRGTDKLSEAISNNQIDIESLFDILKDEIKPPVEKLPDTGVGLEKEKMLSPMFIKSSNYGSRCSTVILMHKNGGVSFSERTFNTKDFSHNTKDFIFQVSEL